MGMFINVCVNSNCPHMSTSMFSCESSMCRVGFKNTAVSQNTLSGPGNI